MSSWGLWAGTSLQSLCSECWCHQVTDDLPEGCEAALCRDLHLQRHWIEWNVCHCNDNCIVRVAHFFEWEKSPFKWSTNGSNKLCYKGAKWRMFLPVFRLFRERNIFETFHERHSLLLNIIIPGSQSAFSKTDAKMLVTVAKRIFDTK